MRRTVVRRRVGSAAALITAIGIAIAGPLPVAAQSGLTITTPYPAVSVQPGASVEFELTVSSREPVRADLAVEGLPDGWTASFSGGGNEVQGVFVERGAPVTVTLAIAVADGASGGRSSLSVVGRAGGDTARLGLDLTVAKAGGGTVTLESDYPALRGAADQEFLFNLTLSNDTPQQLTFSLEAQGPEGWDVSIQPSGETRAASVTVDARGSQRLEVTTTPPAQTAADTYPIAVAVTAGQYRATTDLAVEVTGSVEMRLVTPDQRLNTTANAGATTQFEVVVVNDGTSPLTGVTLSGTGPSEWEISFDPETLERVPPGDSATATALITPSGNAVAGDYSITLSASAESANESLDVRVSVETPPIWGIVGVALIAATLGGMFWVFRRYGRR